MIPSRAASDDTVKFSHIVSRADLGTEDTLIVLSATSHECAALAHRLGVVGIKNVVLEAGLKISSSGGVIAKMKLKALVEQRCCVTLNPVQESISLSFTITYRDACDLEQDNEKEIFEDIDDVHEQPEPLFDGKIDIGVAAIEQLALEINPFPRVKGVEFDGFTTGPRGDEVSQPDKIGPFEVLSKLKPRI